ncbi:MAG: diaminopimelate decarboxylase [Pseudomonadota bacterium]
MDHFQYRDGVMHAEDVSLELLADAVGTPFYCYSRATLERHFDVFANAVSGLANRHGDPLIAYAVKANPNQAVIRTLARRGAGADVVSIGEMKRALAAGVPAERIVFSGVGKTRAEMDAAIAADIYQFNVESLAELEMLSAAADAMGRTVPIGFRVNPDVDAGTHKKISTGRAENKFGIATDLAPGAFRKARELPGLNPLGVAVHIGSQLISLDPLRRAFGEMGSLIVALRDAGHDISRADMGGGLGIPYRSKLPNPPLPAAYGEMVAEATAGWDVRLTFEPGRMIAGNAGILVTRVVRRKEGRVRRFLIIDAAMNDLLRPTLYDAEHDLEPVREALSAEPPIVADVVGPVCESGDTFTEQRELAHFSEGDLMVFRTAGAYGATMASTYNSRLLTPEVMVSGDRWDLVRARETLEQLIARDHIPDWLRDDPPAS